MDKFLKAGKILNTHGIHGEMKIEHYCDDFAFFRSLQTLYIDGAPYPVESVRAHKQFALLKLKGIDTMSAAQACKNKFLLLNRDEAPLAEDRIFMEDLIGFDVYDIRVGRSIGVLSSVFSSPAHDLYNVKDGKNEYLIPAVSEFVKGVDMERRCITICSIKGMTGNED